MARLLQPSTSRLSPESGALSRAPASLDRLTQQFECRAHFSAEILRLLPGYEMANSEARQGST